MQVFAFSRAGHLEAVWLIKKKKKRFVRKWKKIVLILSFDLFSFLAAAQKILILFKDGGVKHPVYSSH